MANHNNRRNRVVSQVEDTVYTAITSLAEREGKSISELIRDILKTTLKQEGLLPESTIDGLAGIRR